VLNVQALKKRKRGGRIKRKRKEALMLPLFSQFSYSAPTRLTGNGERRGEGGRSDIVAFLFFYFYYRNFHTMEYQSKQGKRKGKKESKRK